MTDLLWDDEDNKHFMCCNEPYCPICNTETNIELEKYNGSKRTCYEKADDST